MEHEGRRLWQLAVSGELVIKEAWGRESRTGEKQGSSCASPVRYVYPQQEANVLAQVDLSERT